MAAIYSFPQAETRDLSARCPLLQSCDSVCPGSGSLRSINSHHRSCYCLSDDYDACPTFLAFMLRRSRPKYQASRSLELAFK